MSIYNIHFHDKIRKFSLKHPLMFVFFPYRKNFSGTQKMNSNSYGKRFIGLRVIVVFVCLFVCLDRET